MRSMTVASLPRILQAELAAAFEEFVDGKVSFEDEVAAILDLGDRIKAREVELLAFLGGELRPQDQGPVVEPFADDLRAQLVGGGLQRRRACPGESRGRQRRGRRCRSCGSRSAPGSAPAR